MDVVRVKDNDIVVSGSLLCLRRDRSRGSGQVYGKDKDSGKAQEQIVFGISQVFSLLCMESGQIVLISRS